MSAAVSAQNRPREPRPDQATIQTPDVVMNSTLFSAPIVSSVLTTQNSWWHRLSALMRRSPAWRVYAITSLITIAMGWLDYATGWEVSLFIFYALPIILAVWWAGSLGGMLIAGVSGAVWWIANLEAHPYETQLGYAWALINREFYFGVVVFAVNAVRNKQDEDAARIQMLEERRQLEHDIVKVSEYEQQRIGQDLHDGLCQQLAAIGCAAQMLSEELSHRGVSSARDAALIEESIQQAVMEARNLARGIFPVHVDRSGLSAALTDLAASTTRLTGVQIEVQESGEITIEAPGMAMHLYRIVQEAVANAVRHSGARHILIRIHGSPQQMVLSIEDDGRGIDPASTTFMDGMGLRTMRYRAQTLNAVLKISHRASGGTVILCHIPLPPSQLSASHE